MSTTAPLPASLPALRDDLQLHPAAPHSDGSPAWVIQDPISNVFYRIGWLEFELLARWSHQEPEAILKSAAAETLLRPTEGELAALYEFLLGNQLLSVHHPRYTHYLLERHRKAKLSRAQWLLHHYLFFRWPLVRPAQWLQRLTPAVDWVFSPATAWVIMALGLLGVMLTARQWDGFKSSFLDTLTVGGFWGYAIALAVTKSLHELGHAVTATRYGLRVAHMGVAFVVMWPMLYTDTGESWRLKDRRQRLAIASAGIVTELALAALATLAWNLAPDGSSVKQSLFYLASTAWLISLTLNASPFMRFDGYFILSDALDMPNLHERAGALAKTALRNTLLGWHDADPESLPAGQRRALIAFALVTWLYRLGVFIGIAAAVYLFFFKILGIFLFAVEIVWFILRPIAMELRVWHERRGETRRWRKAGAALLAALLLLVLVLPWQRQVHAEGWAHPAKTHVFYSPMPARLASHAVAGQAIAAKAVAFELDQPELGYRAEVTRSASDTLARQLRGLGGEATGEERRSSLQRQQAQQEAEWTAQQNEADRLLLKAPFDGVLVDVDPELAPGVWTSSRQPLAWLVDPRSWEAEVFVHQSDLERVKAGDAVRFYASAGAAAPLEGTVIDVDATRTTALPHSMLATSHGGTLPVVQEANGLAPRDALYRVRVRMHQMPKDVSVLRGSAVIEGRPHSVLIDWLKPMTVVALRELSF